jgi:hypothetical protein
MRKKEAAMKHRAVEQANAAMMQQLARQEALRMEQVAMQQARMMQQLAMQQAAMAQRRALMMAEWGRPRTVFDTIGYLNGLEMNLMRSGYYGSYGAAPEIDAGPAAAALALLASGVLMLADRRRTRPA